MEKNGDLAKGNPRVTSTQSALKEKSTKAIVTKKSVNNKRAKPDTISPEGFTHEQPTKKQLVDMAEENSERDNDATGANS